MNGDDIIANAGCSVIEDLVMCRERQANGGRKDFVSGRSANEGIQACFLVGRFDLGPDMGMQVSGGEEVEA